MLTVSLPRPVEARSLPGRLPPPFAFCPCENSCLLAAVTCEPVELDALAIETRRSTSLVTLDAVRAQTRRTIELSNLGPIDGGKVHNR